MALSRMAFSPVAGTFQLLFLVLFAIFAKYEKVADESAGAASALHNNRTEPDNKSTTQLYASKSVPEAHVSY